MSNPVAELASPYHDGERAVQERAGVRARMERAGPRMIRNFMPDQHREFFCQLPYLLVGSVDRRMRPWASILVGWPGFVGSPDPWTLTVAARPGFGDPLTGNLREGVPVGLLGIELDTRRRNRMNGRVIGVVDGGFAVRVDQSFGNCPQYIQARAPSFATPPETIAEPHPFHAEGRRLSRRATDMIAQSDTFFIATNSIRAEDDIGRDVPSEGVNVSHRGGKPGFVHIAELDGSTVLTVPDFRGNASFNTLGNIARNPRAGLLFLDFATGDVLSLTGAAELIWDGPMLASFAGAERLLRVRVEEGMLVEGGLPLRWSAAEPAPQLAATGSWSEISAH